MTDPRKDLPPATSANFSEKVREAVQTYLGNRGNPLDRGVTLRDLYESGMIKLRDGFGLGGSGLPIGGPGSAITDSYEPDLTPPPTPTGFEVAAAISNLIITSDAPIYTQGHGHAKAKLYGATWTSGDYPVFADAQVLTEFSGSVGSYATNPATTWHLWLTWVTVDGIESTNPAPAGIINGVVARTGEDVTAMVEAMTGPGNPFTILTVPTVIGGVTYPAGTYTTQAFIMDLQVTSAKIAALAVDDGHVANLSAAKLTIGDGTVGGDLKSTSFSTTPGSEAGWKIQPNGTAVFNNAVVRGGVYASYGLIGGNTIDATSIHSGTTGFGTGSGFYLGSDGRFSLGDKVTWNGSVLTINGGGTFSGALSAATGSFAGSLSAATGSFAGSLTAASGTFAGSLSAATGSFSGYLTASAINAVNTINIAGAAITESFLAPGSSQAVNASAPGPYTIATIGPFTVPAGQTWQITTLQTGGISAFGGGNTENPVNGVTYVEMFYGAGAVTATSCTGTLSVGVAETYALQHTQTYTGGQSVTISSKVSFSSNAGGGGGSARLMVLVMKK